MFTEGDSGMRRAWLNGIATVLAVLTLAATAAPPASAADEPVEGFLRLDRTTLTTDPYAWGTFFEVTAPGCNADLNFQILVDGDWQFLDAKYSTGSDLSLPESVRCIESSVQIDPKALLRKYLPPIEAPEGRAYGPTLPGQYTIRVIAPPDRRAFGPATRDEYGTWHWTYEDFTAATSAPIAVTVTPFTATVAEWSTEDQWVQSGSAREHLHFTVTTLQHADVEVLLEERTSAGIWSTVDSRIQTDAVQSYAWLLPPREHDAEWRIRIPDTPFMKGDVTSPQRVRTYPEVQVSAKLSATEQTYGASPTSLTISTTPAFSGSAWIYKRTATPTGWQGTSVGQVDVIEGAATFTFSPYLAVGTYDLVVNFTPHDYPITVESALVQLTVKEAPPRITRVSRLAGLSRYETAAAVSAATFKQGVNVAYIANGTSFADALSGAAAGGVLGGPVLLSPAGSLPAATKTELSRLQPKRIVLLGGTGVLSENVRTEASRLTTGTVTRQAGLTRYDTSVAISRESFSPSVPVAYIASGLNFPDALAGAATAGALGGPILLTTPDRMPAKVIAELDRLAPQRIVLLGGPAVLSEQVMVDASQRGTAQVTRQYGLSRFDTAIAVSRSAFPQGASVVYVADGMAFPDALAGAAAAGTAEGPVLLSYTDSVPASVLDEIRRLKPLRIVILGGNGAVSERAASQLQTLASSLN